MTKVISFINYKGGSIWGKTTTAFRTCRVHWPNIMVRAYS